MPVSIQQYTYHSSSYCWGKGSRGGNWGGRLCDNISEVIARNKSQIQPVFSVSKFGWEAYRSPTPDCVVTVLWQLVEARSTRCFSFREPSSRHTSHNNRIHYCNNTILTTTTTIVSTTTAVLIPPTCSTTIVTCYSPCFLQPGVRNAPADTVRPRDAGEVEVLLGALGDVLVTSPLVPPSAYEWCSCGVQVAGLRAVLNQRGDVCRVPLGSGNPGLEV